MSKKHPIIAITGSSGAGTTTVKRAFEHLFFRLNIVPAIVEGDSYHAYDREQMRLKIAEAQREGRHFSHFSLEANILAELESLFRQYSVTGVG